MIGMGKECINCCCFFGHRKINSTIEMVENLENIIEILIVQKNVDTFLFGSKSEFDNLCYDAVSKLKEKYPHIKRIYVRSAYEYIDDFYKRNLLDNYEETYYPLKVHGAGKASYVVRNQEMINKSNFCIVYYDENYQPPKRKNSKWDLADYQPKSGTKLAYDYAVRKKRKIINLFLITKA